MVHARNDECLYRVSLPSHTPKGTFQLVETAQAIVARQLQNFRKLPSRDSSVERWKFGPRDNTGDIDPLCSARCCRKFRPQ